MNIIISLAEKRSKLLRMRNELEDQYKARVKEIDTEIKDIEKILCGINEVVEKYKCQTCNGRGTTRICDAAGDMDDIPCKDCCGTGIKI